MINLLSACCEQEQFVEKMKNAEQTYDLMSSIHNLIYIPRDNTQNNHNEDMKESSK